MQNRERARDQNQISYNIAELRLERKGSTKCTEFDMFDTRKNIYSTMRYFREGRTRLKNLLSHFVRECESSGSCHLTLGCILRSKTDHLDAVYI